MFTEQNSGWYLTINVGIGTRKRIQNSVNFMLGFGKNIMGGYLTIGRVKI